MEKIAILILAGVIVLVKLSSQGAIENLPEDPCSGGTLHELRLTDCTRLPCRIERGKTYYVEGDFSIGKLFALNSLCPDKYTEKPIVSCFTKYLGRRVYFPSLANCDTLKNDTCPLQPGKIYTAMLDFNIKRFVFPMTYTIHCALENDDKEKVMCGYGSGKVV